MELSECRGRPLNGIADFLRPVTKCKLHTMVLNAPDFVHVNCLLQHNAQTVTGKYLVFVNSQIASIKRVQMSPLASVPSSFTWQVVTNTARTSSKASLEITEFSNNVQQQYSDRTVAVWNGVQSRMFLWSVLFRQELKK